MSATLARLGALLGRFRPPRRTAAAPASPQPPFAHPSLPIPHFLEPTNMARHRINTCPETGRNLDGYDLAAYAQNMWPSLDPQRLPDTEAGRRYKILLEEHNARMTDPAGKAQA